jgi:hypothetical protein
MSNSQGPLSRKRAFDDANEAHHQHGGKKARINDIDFGMSKDDLEEFGLDDLSEDDEDEKPSASSTHEDNSAANARVVDSHSSNKDTTSEDAADPTPMSRVDSVATSTAQPSAPTEVTKVKKTEEEIAEAREKFRAKKNAWSGKESKPNKRKATDPAETEKLPKKPKNAPAPKGDVAPKKPRAIVKCSACGAEGHTRANRKKCPARNGLAPATAVASTSTTTATQAMTSDDESFLFEDVLTAPVASKEAEQPQSEAEPPSGEASPDELDSLFEDSSNATSQTSALSGEHQFTSAPPQHSRQDTGLTAASMGTQAITSVEIIDLVSDDEESAQNNTWTAKVFVNDVEIGRVEGGDGCKGLRFRKPLPVVKGFLSNYKGYVEGELTIRKSGKAGLRVGGCVPTDSAMKRDPDAKWGDVDVHNLKLQRRKPCKEIRVKVLPGRAQVFQDGKLVLESELESEIVKEKMGYQIRDGPSQKDIDTFEDWRAWSDAQLALGAANLLIWPAFPRKENCWNCQDHGLRCVWDRTSSHGAHIKACAHELKVLLDKSELAKTQAPGDIVQAERDRFAPLQAVWAKDIHAKRKATTEKMRETLNGIHGPAVRLQDREAREAEVKFMVDGILGEDADHVFNELMFAATEAYFERLDKACGWIHEEQKDRRRKLGYW